MDQDFWLKTASVCGMLNILAISIYILHICIKDFKK